MMMNVLVPLALAALGGFFAKGPEEPLDARQVESRARELLEQAYEHPGVVRWCSANPDSVYTVEIDEVSVNVRCAAWHEWKSKREE